MFELSYKIELKRLHGIDIYRATIFVKFNGVKKELDVIQGFSREFTEVNTIKKGRAWKTKLNDQLKQLRAA